VFAFNLGAPLTSGVIGGLEAAPPPPPKISSAATPIRATPPITKISGFVDCGLCFAPFRFDFLLLIDWLLFAHAPGDAEKKVPL
jgi:hypothetical protein